LEWQGVGAFLERIVVEVGAFLEVIAAEETSNFLRLVAEEGSGGRRLTWDDRKVVDGSGPSDLWMDEEVAVSDGIGSFKEPGGDGFKEDGGGRGFETVDDDDFKEDVDVSVVVAANPEYVEEEEGFGFNV
jgi:hypothetical protein